MLSLGGPMLKKNSLTNTINGRISRLETFLSFRKFVSCLMIGIGDKGKMNSWKWKYLVWLRTSHIS